VTEYFSEIWRLRYFWFSLVRTDLRKRYRRSVLGMGWSLLQPIAMTIVLCVVFSKIFNQDVKVFAPYLLCGLTFWGLISATVMHGCQCFLEGESYIRQHPAPLAIYPLRTVLGAGFHFLLGFGIIMVFVWGVHIFGNVSASVSRAEQSSKLPSTGILPAAEKHGQDVDRANFRAGENGTAPTTASAVPIGKKLGMVSQDTPAATTSAAHLRQLIGPALLSLVPTFILMFILVWSLAICMGLANVMFQDAQHLVEILMQVLFYATPIIYPPDALGGRRLVSSVLQWNPLTAFLELIRDPLLKGQIPSLHAYGFAALATLTVAVIAMLGMKRFEKNLIFYL
jgi:ABC-type polysaccharide/polyol phosphate export permease